MFNKIADIKSKKYLLLSVFLISGCANSGPNNASLNQDYCTLIKGTINLEGLQQYYHIDTFPDRVPLIVSVENEDVNCKDLVKFGTAVEVIKKENSPISGDDKHLALTKIEVANDYAIVNFKYIQEGIRGEIKFKKNNSKWVVDHSKIVEF